jgi:hypothetical protein
LQRFVGERVTEAERNGLLADLQRVRFGARPTWPATAALFRRARQTLRVVRRRGAAERPAVG